MISIKDKFLIFMSMYEIPNKKQEILLEQLDNFSIDNVLCNPITYLTLSAEEIKRLKDGYDAFQFENMIENMFKSDIKIVTVFSDEYPSSLINLPDRPLILYTKGDLTLLNKHCFAVVGTRMPSSYGKIVTEKFAKKLAESGLVIVSGLCYGVDQIAHKATLDAGGKTVAIIASGLSRIYPSVNLNLANEIVEKGGLLMSEYPPSFEAKKYTFPRRNRIVAGVCDGILITEAGMKSGTLHTKEFALEYGKDIFAVPGNINSSKSELTNHLIKTGQAECTTSADEIVEFYGLKKSRESSQLVTLNFEEQQIVDLLKEEQQSFDFLAEKTKIPINILNSCLTTLEIRGLIRKLPAQMYCLA